MRSLHGRSSGHRQWWSPLPYQPPLPELPWSGPLSPPLLLSRSIHSKAVSFPSPAHSYHWSRPLSARSYHCNCWAWNPLLSAEKLLAASSFPSPASSDPEPLFHRTAGHTVPPAQPYSPENPAGAVCHSSSRLPRIPSGSAFLTYRQTVLPSDTMSRKLP